MKINLNKLEHPIHLKDKLNDYGEVTTILKNDQLGFDLINSIFGKEIGVGQHRHVFEYNLHSEYVIKHELGDEEQGICNITEFMVYQEALKTGDMEIIKWFAPVKWISPNHKILVMRKTTPVGSGTLSVIMDRVPSFLNDLKPDNFGYIGDQIVCHDYGSFNTFSFDKKLKKANWII